MELTVIDKRITLQSFFIASKEETYIHICSCQHHSTPPHKGVFFQKQVQKTVDTAHKLQVPRGSREEVR